MGKEEEDNQFKVTGSSFCWKNINPRFFDSKLKCIQPSFQSLNQSWRQCGKIMSGPEL